MRSTRFGWFRRQGRRSVRAKKRPVEGAYREGSATSRFASVRQTKEWGDYGGCERTGLSVRQGTCFEPPELKNEEKALGTGCGCPSIAIGVSGRKAFDQRRRCRRISLRWRLRV